MTDTTPKPMTERLEIAILTGETLQLHWVEPGSSQAWWGQVTPQKVAKADGHHWLEGECKGRPVRIRLDCIRNLPTPFK